MRYDFFIPSQYQQIREYVLQHIEHQQTAHHPTVIVGQHTLTFISEYTERKGFYMCLYVDGQTCLGKPLKLSEIMR